jgi:hypothetical protein
MNWPPLRRRAFLLAIFPLGIIALILLPRSLAQQGAPAQNPKLVVVIAVDQMRADYIPRFRGEWHGGLARLVDHGAWFSNAAYPYSGTETCPGHATMGTGVFPETHGIIGNTWWDRATGKTVTCTQDATVRDLSNTGRTATPGDSPAELRASTFAERLRKAQSGSRVVAISLKARAAIMLAGHQADAVLWQDEAAGDWMTSSAYASEMPPFARAFFNANPPLADLPKVWNLSMAESKYHNARSVAGENPPTGWTTSFPHPLGGSNPPLPGGLQVSKMVGLWRASPFSDEYLERLAAAAVDSMKLGRGPGTDFLGISFSAPDYIGHAFGPGSREIEDEYLRLDQTMGKLLDELDRAVGAGNYIVALTADHGVAPIPEQSQTQTTKGGRVDTKGIIAAVEKVLAQRLGSGRHVASMVDQNIYFQAGVMQRIHADPSLWRDVQAAILAQPGVRGVFESSELGQRFGGDTAEHAAALDTFSGRSGDVIIALKPYWILSSAGTTHGSSNDYDQRVPLILFGAGVKTGQYAEDASPADIAPTLALLCGIPPAKTEGSALTDAMQPRNSATAP